MQNSYKDRLNECIDGYDAVFDRLQDEESRKLFNYKIEWMFDQDDEKWIHRICSLYDDWDIDRYINGMSGEELIIYGFGHEGKECYKMLKEMGVKIKGFCVTKYEKADVMQENRYVDELPVYEVGSIIDEKKYMYLIASDKFRHEMYHVLKQNGVSEKNILISTYRYPLLVRGNQYFDVFNPLEKEIFLDCGAYDGDTIDSFLKWCQGNAYSAYALEPDEEACKKIQDKFGDKNVCIVHGAVWDKEEQLRFSSMDTAGHIDSNGRNIIKGIVIDNLFKEVMPTYIKMDIEGAELKALMGAKETIKRNKPRLAICVYHKTADVLEIGNYILKLVPEYKFWLRHYTSSLFETVLYAEV